ncbi:MAG: lipid-A-disaccharide synthase [Bacteroidales bacterium]|nr:lipid-A-disaccharide synthase [Bacteroidales bacterium]
MRYFLIAGEASGDLHASNLMRELRNNDSNAEFCFLGGDLMQAQGGTMIKHYRQMAFMGFWAVIKNAGKVLNNINDCKKALAGFQPDVLILVDYPGFNLRMARFAKEQLAIPVYYYISPKLWAWKEYRIKDIKRYVDKMFTIFPFETGFYNKHNYPVEYVGNPSVDSVFLRPNQDQTFKDFCSKNKLEHKPVIAILAGSRKQEISACLPRMIESARRFPGHQIIVGGAPGIDPAFYKSVVGDNEVNIVFGQTYDLLQHARAAIVNSGTATLETALIGTPQVVVYHVMFGRIAYVMKNILIKVKFVSLVNLICQKEVVKELVAHYFTVENVTNELDKLLHNETYRQNMLHEYDEIIKTLGGPGTAERAAKKMVEALGK